MILFINKNPNNIAATGFDMNTYQPKWQLHFIKLLKLCQMNFGQTFDNKKSLKLSLSGQCQHFLLAGINIIIYSTMYIIL